MKTINISFTDLAIASELKDVMRGRQAIKIGNLEFFGVDLNFHCNGGYMKASEAVRLPWNGEGLPPVGIECEANMPPCGLRKEYAWRRVKVAHGSLPDSTGEILVFDIESTQPAWVDEFRPLRTPEQIAAEEREKAAMELFLTINWNDTEHDWKSMDQMRRNDYLKAIDAGYSKTTE